MRENVWHVCTGANDKDDYGGWINPLFADDPVEEPLAFPADFLCGSVKMLSVIETKIKGVAQFDLPAARSADTTFPISGFSREQHSTYPDDERPSWSWPEYSSYLPSVQWYSVIASMMSLALIFGPHVHVHQSPVNTIGTERASLTSIWQHKKPHCDKSRS